MSKKYSQKKGSFKNPYSSISPEDFEKMCKAVDKAFSQVGSVVGQATQQAASTVQQSAYLSQQQAALQAKQEAAAQASLVKSRFKSTVGLTVSGVLMILVGGSAALLLTNFAVLGAVVQFAAEMSATEDIVGFVVMGAIALGFVLLMVLGIRNLITASNLRALQRAFGTSEALLFTDLATRLHTTADQARKRAAKLVKRGLIPEGRIDDENTTLMVTNNAYQQYCQVRQSRQQLLEQQKADQAARAADEAARLARDKELASRLTPSQRAFLAEVRGYQSRLRELDELIDDALVSERIVAIEGILARILARAEEAPSVIAGIGRLTSYYLPTTVKLLVSYDNLEDQPVQGENVSNSRREIEKTLEVLRAAFEKLLDDTYHEMSIDVSTDISVLHSILAREGLVDGPFDIKSS